LIIEKRHQTVFSHIEAIFFFTIKSHGGKPDHGDFVVGIFCWGDGIGGFDERVEWL